MEKGSHRIQLTALVVVYLLLSLVYSGYIISDSVLGRDDTLLIYPLKTVGNLSEYFEAVASNHIVDVQPLRDLSFLVNIKLYEWFSFSSFHLFNLLVFFGCIYNFQKILNVLKFSTSTIIWGTLFFSLHPLMVSSVGWISSRKHSVALLFLLLSVHHFLKSKSLTWKSVVYFFLSILSHQIFILYPIWIVVYSKLKNWDLKKTIFLTMIVSGGIVFGLATYKTFYLNVGDVYYTPGPVFQNISRYILSIGRSSSLIFFPVSIAATYYQGSIWNIVGIPLVIIVLFIFYRNRNRKEIFLWLSLAVLAHIPTYIAFINDTYLYLALICIILAFAYYAESLSIKLPNWSKNGFLGFILILLSFKSYEASRMWRSDLDLWQYSYKNEPSPYNAIVLSGYLSRYNENMALELLIWGAKNFDFNGQLPQLTYFLTTIYTSSLPIDEKIRIFEDCYYESDLYKSFYGVALLEGTSVQMDKGIQILKPLLKSEDAYAVGSNEMKIIKSIRYLCENIEDKKTACETLNIRYQENSHER